MSVSLMKTKMSKYLPLWDFVSISKNFPLKMSFEDIKNVLGFEIDHSFLKYKKELELFGYKVLKISLKEKFIVFDESEKESCYGKKG